MYTISCHVLLAVALSAAFPAQARNEGRPVPSGREPAHGIARARHGGPTLAVGAPFRRSVLPASLSGVTWAGGNKYYAVSDDASTGEVGLYPMAIELSASGLSVVSCSIPPPASRIPLAGAHDLEAVAFDAAAGTVWAADESRCTVKEYRVADGSAVRMLPLPRELRKPRPNLGIESLTLSPDGRTLWTCTEEALACVVRRPCLGVWQLRGHLPWAAPSGRQAERAARFRRGRRGLSAHDPADGFLQRAIASRRLWRSACASFMV